MTVEKRYFHVIEIYRRTILVHHGGQRNIHDVNDKRKNKKKIKPKLSIEKLIFL